MLTIKNEYVLVISLALGFVYLFICPTDNWAARPCRPLEALNVVVTGGRKGQKPNMYPVRLM